MKPGYQRFHGSNHYNNDCKWTTQIFLTNPNCIFIHSLLHNNLVSKNRLLADTTSLRKVLIRRKWKVQTTKLHLWMKRNSLWFITMLILCYHCIPQKIEECKTVADWLRQFRTSQDGSIFNQGDDDLQKFEETLSRQKNQSRFHQKCVNNNFLFANKRKKRNLLVKLKRIFLLDGGFNFWRLVCICGLKILFQKFLNLFLFAKLF
jgi:hypothetical protein